MYDPLGLYAEPASVSSKLGSRTALAEEEALLEAIRWWRSMGPIRGGLEEHLEHPQVNTGDSRSSALAQAVANLVKISAHWRLRAEDF